MINIYSILNQTQRERVSDGAIAPIIENTQSAPRLLVLIWSQLGDFDSLESTWWLQREAELLTKEGLAIRAIGIGDRASGNQFCNYTGFPCFLWILMLNYTAN